MPVTYSMTVLGNPNVTTLAVDVTTQDAVDWGELVTFTEERALHIGMAELAKEIALRYAARVKIAAPIYLGKGKSPINVVAEFTGNDPIAINARPLYAALKKIVDYWRSDTGEAEDFDQAIIEAEEVLKQISGR